MVSHESIGKIMVSHGAMERRDANATSSYDAAESGYFENA
jgi:hypothetical protein